MNSQLNGFNKWTYGYGKWTWMNKWQNICWFCFHFFFYFFFFFVLAVLVANVCFVIRMSTIKTELAKGERIAFGCYTKTWIEWICSRLTRKFLFIFLKLFTNVWKQKKNRRKIDTHVLQQNLFVFLLQFLLSLLSFLV